MNLALDLLDDGERVVALDSSPDPEMLDKFKRHGGLCLAYVISPTLDYSIVGIANASTFTAVMPDDALNLASAYAVEESHVIKHDGGKLVIHAHVGNVALRDLLERNSFFVSENEGCACIKIFNSYANMARLILREFPPEMAGFSDGPVNSQREIHMVLPGSNFEAMALLMQAAKVGHYLGGRKIHFHIICENAAGVVRAVLSHYPSLEKCCASLSAIEEKEEMSFGRAAGLLVNRHDKACITVVPCFESDPKHLATVMRIHEEVKGDMPYRLLLPVGLKDFLDSAVRRNPRLFGCVSWFRDDSECCSRDAVFKEEMDRVARVIHEKWIEETKNQIRVAEEAENHVKAKLLRAKPAYKTWHELSEDQKNANRSQADHAAVKIRAVGMDPNRTSGKSWATWCSDHKAEIEQLARVEHERWAANLWIGGWSYGKHRDDTRKLHDNLVAYENLDQATKDYDIDAVKGLARYL